ncbi:MAG: histidinol phosphate phosphatase domain-containing protein [Dehalococcoidales bacterium]|nr:histidinol phosphate phosphatase domain-containing protein [Dehalococcoidales bacterium]
MIDMVYDFHTHTSLSDGDLSPMEMVRRAAVNGYSAVALTDHAAAGDMERIIPEICRACAAARKYWNILAIPGIELTHLPAAAVAEAARTAKELGAWIVVVHGETIVEPVEPGTNLSALKSPDVDILAHPGLLTREEAELAAKLDVFLEISARKGHSLTNGHVAKLAKKAGARLLVDSDAHTDSDLLTDEFAGTVIRGAGVDEAGCRAALVTNPQFLIEKLRGRFGL